MCGVRGPSIQCKNPIMYSTDGQYIFLSRCMRSTNCWLSRRATERWINSTHSVGCQSRAHPGRDASTRCWSACHADQFGEVCGMHVLAAIKQRIGCLSSRRCKSTAVRRQPPAGTFGYISRSRVAGRLCTLQRPPPGSPGFESCIRFLFRPDFAPSIKRHPASLVSTDGNDLPVAGFLLPC
jgi:hypothetical protein